MRAVAISPMLEFKDFCVGQGAGHCMEWTTQRARRHQPLDAATRPVRGAVFVSIRYVHVCYAGPSKLWMLAIGSGSI
jgi:hypothetical protein